jgi:alpha-L-fucosidase
MMLPIFKTVSQERFEDAKYGMFIHWGLYSLLERGEWVKFVENIPHEEYEKLRTRFNPVNYDADRWAQLMQDAGIQYVVITARHHDGFSMFETKQSPEWSISNTPYAKDVMRPLIDACRKRGIMFFFYYSLLDWTRADYKNDFHSYLAFMHRQLIELCENYGRIDGFWFDGVNFITDWRKWDFDSILRTIRIRQPHALICINQAFLGEGNRITVHGDVDLITYEKHGIRPLYQAGPKYLARECCTTIGAEWWGYHKDENVITPQEALTGLVTNLCKGGNFLLNTGPDGLGKIPQAHQDCYRAVGKWLKTNGEAVYGTRPSGLALGKWGGSVIKGDTLYYHIWDMPADRRLEVEMPCREIRSLMALATGKSVKFEQNEHTLSIDLADVQQNDMVTVLKADLEGDCRWFKIECEDYVSGGLSFYHHPVTNNPLNECYRKDDLGCRPIDSEPNGITMFARRGMSYLYHVAMPKAGSIEIFLRVQGVIDDRATAEPLMVSVDCAAQPLLTKKVLPAQQHVYTTISLGIANFNEGEYYLSLNIESGCALIDYLKFIYR